MVAVALLVPATTALGMTAAAATPLPTGIPSILRSYGLAVGGTGVTIVDLTDGQVAYRYHAWKQLAPASNEKLITTVAALSTLRPGFRYETTLSGSGVRAGATYRGDIYLVGAGRSDADDRQPRRRSPSDSAQSGVRHVAGAILGDETIFDRMRFGPQWKTSFYGTESPPLSGLTVNRNTAPNGHMLPNPALRRRTPHAQGADRAGHHGLRAARAPARCRSARASSARCARSRSG